MLVILSEAKDLLWSIAGLSSGRESDLRARRGTGTAPFCRRHYVWVRGFYDWQGDDWVWVPGHWVAPPERSVRWVSPRYVRVDEGWRYEPAHWSNQRLVVVDEKGKVKKEKVKKEKVKVKKEKIKD